MFSVCVCYCWVMKRLMCSASEQFADGCSALCWGGTNTVKSISPLPCSAALNEVAMSSSLTCNMPHLFSPKCSFFCQRWAAVSLPYKHAFSKFILLFVWGNKCDSVLLSYCVRVAWLCHGLSSASGSQIMTLLSLEGGHCVCENV